MNETYVTLVGNVASDVKHRTSERGIHIASFRLASSARRFDRGQQCWVDGDTMFMTVTCWRQLAENVASSVAKGHPVVVSGRLQTNIWEAETGKRVSVEVTAHAVGHDLSRGTAAFRRSSTAEESGGSREQEVPTQAADAA
jgi:single-strand DNA-binding protein